MRLIINTTTLSGTGVTQVAVSFINECRNFPENEYHIFLSTSVKKEINQSNFSENFFFYEFNSHPLYGIRGFSVRKRLKELENSIKPDAVFTVFGPACWTPKCRHLTGFANSYYVYQDLPFFKIIPLKDKLRIKLMAAAHRFFLKRNGNFFVCETSDMSNRLSAFLGIPSQNIFTVSNTYNNFFEVISNKNTKLLPVKDVTEYRLLSLASFDIHKNLTIINQIVPLLQDLLPDVKLKFVLTIDEEKLEEYFTLEAKKHIINLGRVNVRDCPQLYTECDALFLPTLIESFSANYPEAMIMNRPILTSHYSFAKSICGDAAIYFDPLDPKDIAFIIEKIIREPELSKELIEKGKMRVAEFGSSAHRAKRYLNILKNLK